MVGEVNQLQDSSLKWFKCFEIYNICWKIIPYIYYSYTKEETSRCTATKRLIQFVGMTPGACTANFKIITCTAHTFPSTRHSRSRVVMHPLRRRKEKKTTSKPHRHLFRFVFSFCAPIGLSVLLSGMFFCSRLDCAAPIQTWTSTLYVKVMCVCDTL